MNPHIFIFPPVITAEQHQELTGILFLPPRPFNLPAEFADNGSHSRARRPCRKAFLNNFLLIFTAHFIWDYWFDYWFERQAEKFNNWRWKVVLVCFSRFSSEWRNWWKNLISAIITVNAESKLNKQSCITSTSLLWIIPFSSTLKVISSLCRVVIVNGQKIITYIY